MTKQQQLRKAANKLSLKKAEPIPLDNKTRHQVLATLKRPDVLIVSDQPISDISDEGHYKLVDKNNNVLYELLISPFTIRLVQHGKVIARCNIQPIRDELYDDIEITDDNMEHITFEIIRLYNLHHSQTKNVIATKQKAR